MATSPVFDVVVVGGGIMGSSAAAYAAKAGGRVVLLEQFDLLHRRGSSHGESRITRRTYPSKQYTNLMKASYRLWEEAQRESNMSSVYRKTGGIDVLRTDSETYKALVDSCEANAVPIDLLTAKQLRAEYGLVFDDSFTAVRQADTGTLRATEAVAMYQQLAIRHGAQLRERCPVVSCVRGPAPDGTTATAVTIAGGEVVYGRRVVLACGPWAGPILKSLVGLELPLIVWQCTVMYFKAAEAAAADVAAPAAAGGAAAVPASASASKSNQDLLTSLPVLIDYGNKPLWTSTVDDYSTPTGEEVMPSIYSCPAGEYPGLIKFAVHEGAVTTADDRTFTPHPITVAPVTSWLKAHVPFVDPAPVMSDTCLYTMTPDEDFVIDTCPGRDDIVIGCGFSGHGFKFGSIVGKILADLALTGTTEHDISMFAVDRPALKAKPVAAAASATAAAAGAATA